MIESAVSKPRKAKEQPTKGGERMSKLLKELERHHSVLEQVARSRSKRLPRNKFMSE